MAPPPTTRALTWVFMLLCSVRSICAETYYAQRRRHRRKSIRRNIRQNRPLELCLSKGTTCIVRPAHNHRLSMTNNVTTSTIEEIWQGDAFERHKDAEILRHFTLGHLDLRARAKEPRTYVLNLDASWGTGKSFFLTKFKRHLEAHGHIAVYINAWESDHSEDPFMAVMDEIETELSKHLPADGGNVIERTASLRKSAVKIIGGAAFAGGKHLLTRYLGQEAVEELGKFADSKQELNEGERKDLEAALKKSVEFAVDSAGQEILSQFRHQKQVQQNFRQQLRELGKEVLAQKKQAPIFILIDELDRCRPSYAIELLERVKHIFSLDNFVYVLGTDTSQLSKAIKGVYGAEFDGERYLKRFIDRSYHFQPADTNRLVEFCFARNGLDEEMFTCLPDFTAEEFLAKCLGETETKARDIKRIIERIGTFCAAWQVKDAKINIVRLFPLVYQRHFSLSESALNDYLLNKCHFKAIKYSSGRQYESAQTSLQYRGICRMIDQHSSPGSNNSSSNTSVDHWIHSANTQWEKHYSVLNLEMLNQQSVGAGYARMLDQVAHISSQNESD
ncbi:hypothetical protein GG681_08245 [Epibacterium sp. SM1969]|uniref:KAP NTPase domain-containing protein n=1 Tax=Tritonibacter aquimaris TaxID=2663379 RepID=A0A844AXJ7_9RHOB|nr:P-loop NTPase fold protein [Tritonibacter aquimaris]MQY42632.1 hypothetical protein [Tritonibacter aquimaris]